MCGHMTDMSKTSTFDHSYQVSQQRVKKLGKLYAPLSDSEYQQPRDSYIPHSNFGCEGHKDERYFSKQEEYSKMARMMAMNFHGIFSIM